MSGSPLKAGATLIGLFLMSCTFAPPITPGNSAMPGQLASQIVKERLSAVVVTSRSELGSWAKNRFSSSDAPNDADGGSAAPITEDGYFLTADHVLAHSDTKNVFIVYGSGGAVVAGKARIVWRSKSDDLALLRIARKTPYFYRWTSPGEWLSPGHGVIHGGMATGSRSAPGKLRTALSPETPLTGNRPFKIDIPLKPGDSGGPIVDSFGKLVGINSAVEFIVPLETAIFIDSEGVRPNIGKIDAIIRRDRRSHPSS